MRAGDSGLNCQHGVQQKHALTGPAFKIRASAHGYAQIRLDLLEYILQGRRGRHVRRHGERKSHGLAGPMIRILTEDHDFHLRQRSKLESLENQASGRIDDLSGLFFIMQKTHQRGEVRFFELVAQCVFPSLFYLNVHYSKIYPITSSIVLTYTKVRPFT